MATFVQNIFGKVSSSSTNSLQSGAAVTAPTTGNMLVVLVAIANNGNIPQVTSVTDTASNVFTKDRTIGDSGGSVNVSVWRKFSCATTATYKVTVNINVVGSACVFAVLEWSPAGIFTVDGGNSAAPAGASTSPAPGSATPSTTADVAIAVAATFSAADTWTQPSGFNRAATDTGATASCSCDLDYLLLSSGAAINPTWSITASNQWAALQQLYQDSGGGGSPTQLLPPKSQRYDPLPDWTANWVPWMPIPVKLQPPTSPTNQSPSTFQPSQRFDPLPDLTAGWVPWEPLPQKLLPPTAGVPNPVQGSQRFDPLPDITAANVPWQRLPVKTTPPTAVLPATRQPSQRIDPLPVFDFLWWEPLRVLQPLPTAGLPATRQPSQRYDALPDFWQGGVSWVPMRFQPFTIQPLLPPKSQRFDPLPVLDNLWWQFRPLTQPSFFPVPTRQPSQRFDPLPVLDSLWWTFPVKQPLPTAGLPYTFQPSQRYDPLPVLDGLWWQIRFPVPAGASVVPTRQPSQRYDPLPDYGYPYPILRAAQNLAGSNVPPLLPVPQLYRGFYVPDPFGGFVPWTPRVIASPPSFSAVPTKQPSQRYDSLIDQTFTWWQFRPSFLAGLIIPAALAPDGIFYDEDRRLVFAELARLLGFVEPRRPLDWIDPRY